ncbi:hypothetical protein AYI69_g1360 [Smittium culicis]|uniref:Uncharacterized protein n=1 Tax=Smittium culicis TaxID=133412 RepID=A0A1R1YQL3_9FUNG|nr:hypothetical protein AYI69_g1360 [Smittium culicis]
MLTPQRVCDYRKSVDHSAKEFVKIKEYEAKKIAKSYTFGSKVAIISSMAIDGINKRNSSSDLGLVSNNNPTKLLVGRISWIDDFDVEEHDSRIDTDPPIEAQSNLSI